MTEQYDIFGNADIIKPTPNANSKEQRNWENAFQRWSDKSITKEIITEPYGVCGYGSMCEYCEDNTYGRPCVRALNEMCRKENIKIDYSKRNFEDIWDGEFE